MASFFKRLPSVRDLILPRAAYIIIAVLILAFGGAQKLIKSVSSGYDVVYSGFCTPIELMVYEWEKSSEYGYTQYAGPRLRVVYVNDENEEHELLISNAYAIVAFHQDPTTRIFIKVDSDGDLSDLKINPDPSELE